MDKTASKKKWMTIFYENKSEEQKGMIETMGFGVDVHLEDLGDVKICRKRERMGQLLYPAKRLDTIRMDQVLCWKVDKVG